MILLKLGLAGEQFKVVEGSLVNYDFPQTEDLSIQGVKNSRVSFQLLLQSDEEFLLTVSANPVFDQTGTCEHSPR